MFKNKHCVCQYMSLVHTIQLSAHTTKRLHEYRENCIRSQCQVLPDICELMITFESDSSWISSFFTQILVKNWQKRRRHRRKTKNSIQVKIFHIQVFLFYIHTESCWWQHPWVKFFAHFYLRSFFTPTVYTQTPDDDMFLICKWHDKVRRKNNENLTWLPWLRNNTTLTITCCSSRSYISYVQASKLHYSAHMILLVPLCKTNVRDKISDFLETFFEKTQISKLF